MGLLLFVICALIALTLIAGAFKAPANLRTPLLIGALAVFIGGIFCGSVVYVGSDEVGVVSKSAFGASLKEGRIIAVGGEMGVQADVLPPGWHTGYWPLIYSVRTSPLTDIKSDEVGIIEARDGQSLDPGQLFAPEFPRGEEQKMLDARYFLTTGKGRKGTQSTVLTPGKYRINTELFRVSSVKQTEVLAGEVAVVKANFGQPASIVVGGIAGEHGGPVEPARDAGKPAPAPADSDERLRLADNGEMGVRKIVLGPGKYPINTQAYTVVEVWATQMIAHFTASHAANPTSDAKGHAVQEEREITVRTSDGFTFPVDVRIEYHIKPENAPIVVAKLGDDEGDRFRNALNSVVRATFRNSAENVKALDYVRLRSEQEKLSLGRLAEAMARYGVTVTAVRIGDVGDEKSLGALLKTQTDREIATQEQLTFQEQQKAAEKKKELTRVTQESEEEKKLATAAYEVKISEQNKTKKVIEANADAESLKIKAGAQADAFKLIATQIGKSNAALLEMLKVVGERNIQITPRIMINGSAGGQSAGGTALIGTMLDSMLSKQDDDEKKPGPARP